MSENKSKYKKFLRRFLFMSGPIIVGLLVASTGKWFEHMEYVFFTVLYGSFAYYLLLVYYIRNLLKRKKRRKIYYWMDNYEGDKGFLKRLFLANKQEDLQINLEFLHRKLNYYTGYNIKKLKLLKAYFQVKNNEGPEDFFDKTFIVVLTGITVWIINKGILWGWASVTNENPNLKIDNTYITVHNYIFFIGYILFFFMDLIKENFKGKRRNMLLVEVLDVCIEQAEKLNNAKK